MLAFGTVMLDLFANRLRAERGLLIAFAASRPSAEKPQTGA
jgi:hypothetical protein